MNLPDFSNTDRFELARLLKLDANAPGWESRDLQGILKHQLEAPLADDLCEAFPDHRENIQQLLASQEPPVHTFGELLSQPRPAQDVLELAKQFAKQNRVRENGPLHPKVATVLYYAVIVAAFLRTRGKISSLDTSTQVDGIRWALKEPWVDDGTRALLQDGLRKMAPGRKE